MRLALPQRNDQFAGISRSPLQRLGQKEAAMRKAISIVLAGLLVLLPVEQVLAQAVQQEAVSVKQSEPADGAARLFRVPPLTENDVRLLRTSSERALLDPGFSDAPFVQQEADDGLTWEEWAIVLGAVVVVGAVVGGVLAEG